MLHTINCYNVYYVQKNYQYPSSVVKHIQTLNVMLHCSTLVVIKTTSYISLSLFTEIVAHCAQFPLLVSAAVLTTEKTQLT